MLMFITASVYCRQDVSFSFDIGPYCFPFVLSLHLSFWVLYFTLFICILCFKIALLPLVFVANLLNHSLPIGTLPVLGLSPYTSFLLNNNIIKEQICFTVVLNTAGAILYLLGFASNYFIDWKASLLK